MKYSLEKDRTHMFGQTDRRYKTETIVNTAFNSNTSINPLFEHSLRRSCIKGQLVFNL